MLNVASVGPSDRPERDPTERPSAAADPQPVANASFMESVTGYLSSYWCVRNGVMGFVTGSWGNGYLSSY
eukprot:gene24034-10140_t